MTEKSVFQSNKHGHGSAAGFTLVELIVVIAILAILAGVAVPVYSGYIKKAHRAADETLLGAVNTAFASACTENRSSPKTETGVLLLAADGSVASVGVYDDDFLRYYGANANLTFSDGVTSGHFRRSAETGLFEFRDSPIDLGTAEQHAAWQASHFASNTGAIADSVGKLGALMNENTGNNIWPLQDFKDYLARLGIDTNAEDFDQNDYDTGVLVTLWLSDKLSNRTVDEIYDSMVDSFAYTDLSKLIKAKGLPNVAADVTAGYATAIAYSLTDEGKDARLSFNYMGTDYDIALTEYLADPAMFGVRGSNVVKVLSSLRNDEGYQDYLESDAVMTDLAGLQSMLQIVNNNIDYGDGSGGGLDYDGVMDLLGDNAGMQMLLASLSG